MTGDAGHVEIIQGIWHSRNVDDVRYADVRGLQALV
jgi:hypothetical protein